jgi:type II secretory ATPase GspE/PulE/Tfp pilus assembly ATPase PilB-like protein
VAYEPEPEILQEMEVKKGSSVTLYHPTGCEKCNHTGFWGRTAVYELLRVTPAIKQAILAEKTLEQITKKARVEGMSSLYEKGVNKVLEGITSVEEILRVLRF